MSKRNIRDKVERQVRCATALLYSLLCRVRDPGVADFALVLDWRQMTGLVENGPQALRPAGRLLHMWLVS